jgi:hypothetical protein
MSAFGGGNFASAKLNSPVYQCAKGCGRVLGEWLAGEVLGFLGAAGLRRAAATWGVPHTPRPARGGFWCDEELPEQRKWLYKLIHNDNLNRLTFKMVEL